MPGFRRFPLEIPTRGQAHPCHQRWVMDAEAEHVGMDAPFVFERQMFSTELHVSNMELLGEQEQRFGWTFSIPDSAKNQNTNEMDLQLN